LWSQCATDVSAIDAPDLAASCCTNQPANCAAFSAANQPSVESAHSAAVVPTIITTQYQAHKSTVQYAY
jgi:hypothetical protein